MPDNKLPKHIAIIPDGNRRWAKEKDLPTFFGHQKGFDQASELAKESRKLGIKVFTLWCFSTENWNRTDEEIKYLMDLYEKMIDKNLIEAKKERVRLIHLGRKDRINDKLRRKIENAEKETKHFHDFYLVFALDYGGRDEIIRAISKLLSEKRPLPPLGEELFAQFLDTAELPYPYPDLVIRTSGEFRLSGFLAWQSTYSEFIFCKKYFPDFDVKELHKCLAIYQKRQRRFGK